MGRNAKLYKSAHKGKKKQSSSIQDSISDTISSDMKSSGADKRGKHNDISANLMLRRRNALQEETKKKSGNPLDDAETQIATATRDTGSNGKLKSKLWRDLEAKRAKEGKREFATPKEAGIDYLSQWEKKGR